MRLRGSLLSVGLLTAACGDPGDGARAAPALPDCAPRCVEKIDACQLLVGDLSTYCEEFCAQGLERDQLECYAAATCEALWYGSHGCLYGLHCEKRTCRCGDQLHTGHFETEGRCAESCAEVCAVFEAFGA